METSSVAIRAKSLGKAYRIGARENHETLFSQLVAMVRAPMANFRNIRKLRSFDADDETDVVWALRDTSFEIKRGEVVGIVGRNGAGKSTLLKLLCRITRPTLGEAEVFGRLGSLLEVGTGFHPDLTGRENVFLNGTILGMKRWEVAKKFTEIVEFAGVEKFIDTPVKRFSSGMRMRLAFSVAAHLEPEILIIDEVLAVGDAEFQKRCLGRMKSVAGEGRTVLFVSHNMGAVAALCSRVICMEAGTLQFDGSPAAGIAQYLRSNAAMASKSAVERTDRQGSQAMKMTRVVLLAPDGEAVDQVAAGCDLQVEISYQLSVPELTNVNVQINFLDSMGQSLFACFTKTVNAEFKSLESSGRIVCHIPELPLAPGAYTITIVCKHTKSRVLDHLEAAAELTVIEGNFFGTGRMPPADCGPFLVRHEWRLLPEGGAGFPFANSQEMAASSAP